MSIEEDNIEELEDVIQEEAINIEVDGNEENIEEGAYITDVDSISESEGQAQEGSFETLVNDFDDVNEKMDRILEDINESRYYSDEEDVSLCPDDEDIIKDVSESEDERPSEGIRKSTRKNAGTGVDRLEPRHDGKHTRGN